MEGKWLTSYPTLKTDLINAGAEWIDEEVVIDHNLITSRSPKDLPAFCEKMVEVVMKRNPEISSKNQYQSLRDNAFLSC